MCPIDETHKFSYDYLPMKKIFMALTFGMFMFSLKGYAITLVDNSDITVFGTVFNQYVPSNTIDDNLDSFWHGTNDIQIGQTNFLAYHFDIPYDLSQIDFFENYQNRYLMGELDIQTSQNSTDGIDGLWINQIHINGDFNPANGDFTQLVDFDSTQWVRLFMTYQGRGAHGSSPAFYLSEIDFYGEKPSIIIPEPSTLFLLGTGLLGLVFRRKRV